MLFRQHALSRRLECEWQLHEFGKLCGVTLFDLYFHILGGHSLLILTREDVTLMLKHSVINTHHCSFHCDHLNVLNHTLLEVVDPERNTTVWFSMLAMQQFSPSLLKAPELSSDTLFQAFVQPVADRHTARHEVRFFTKKTKKTI